MKTDKFYFILTDKSNTGALLVPEDDGWTLPYCEVAVSEEIDPSDTLCFNRAVSEMYGIKATTLYALDAQSDGESIKVAAMENHTPGWELPPHQPEKRASPCGGVKFFSTFSAV